MHADRNRNVGTFQSGNQAQQSGYHSVYRQALWWISSPKTSKPLHVSKVQWSAPLIPEPGRQRQGESLCSRTVLIYRTSSRDS